MTLQGNSENHLTPEELIRFGRHINLPEIGVNGQKRLKEASVLCVGAGGLGSPILLYLAAAGVGRIGIIDSDSVDQSNLQRQIIHDTNWLNKPKISSARARILDINPNCKVNTYKKALTSDNALEIIHKYDIVCDASDNFPTRYLINDACVLLNKPNVFGSVNQFEGQVTVFNLNNKSPNFRDLIPEPPQPGMIPSCSEAGVLGVLPGIIGIIQATETIKIITEIGESLSGRLLVFNGLTMRFKELKLSPDKNRTKIRTLIDYNKFCGLGIAKNQANAGYWPENISTKKLKNLLEHRPNEIAIIDVREPYETEITSIQEADLIPLGEIENKQTIKSIKKLIANKKLYVICKSGNRSIKALYKLAQYGIDGTNVKGGMDKWPL